MISGRKKDSLERLERKYISKVTLFFIINSKMHVIVNGSLFSLEKMEICHRNVTT